VAGRKKRKPEQGGGVPGWMVTYGDMMTLLLCFFILLFSFSTIDVVKFRDVIVELQGALGVLSGGPMVLNLGDIPAKQVTENPSASTRRLEGIKEEIEKKAAEENMSDNVQVTINERGLMIRFTDTALFDLGKADVKPEAVPVLDAIGEELMEVSNRVAIEGHTDPTPINTPQFPSNWELSTARASAVVHYMIEVSGIAPDRLSASGFSYYHPVVPNNTPEDQAQNRRVDVLILKSDTDAELDRRQDTLEFLESPESDGIVELPVLEAEDIPEDESAEAEAERRQAALDFLESTESDGIVNLPIQDEEEEEEEEEGNE